jgi:hypothetical protein
VESSKVEERKKIQERNKRSHKQKFNRRNLLRISFLCAGFDHKESPTDTSLKTHIAETWDKFNFNEKLWKSAISPRKAENPKSQNYEIPKIDTHSRTAIIRFRIDKRLQEIGRE